MRRLHRAALMLALIVMPVVSASAQDLEVFDLETFLDPGILTVRDESGQPHDLAFFAAYLRTGVSRNFQYRSEYLRSMVGSVDATGTFIYRRLQLTGRFTGYGYEQSGTGAAGRAEARVGYYFVSPPSETSESPVITRLQLSLARTTASRQLGGTVLGIDADISALAPYDVIGGLSYSFYRPDSKCKRGCTEAESESTQFLSANFRTETWQPGERFGVDLGAGAGLSYRRRELRWDTLRVEMRLKRRSLEGHWSVYGVYAPAYRLDGGASGPRLNHEVSLFLHLRVWSQAAELSR